MYKRIAFILALVVISIAPATALTGEHYIWNQTAYIDGNVFAGDTLSTVDPNSICGAYGKSVVGFPYTIRTYKFYCKELPVDFASTTTCAHDNYISHPGTITILNLSTSPQYKYFLQSANCQWYAGGGFYTGWRAYNYYNSTAYLPKYPPSANYTCNFNSGYPYENTPFSLVCTNASTGNPVGAVEWALTNPDASVYTTTNTSLIRTLTQEGWYGINFKSCNSEGCGYKNTTQLINITSGLIPATGISFWAHAYDPLKNAKIAGATVGIQNLTTGVWRNLSTSSGSANFVSTDYYLIDKLTAGQTVGLMASATGYVTANTTVTIPYSGWEYKINLASTSTVPTGTNATLFVNAINSYTAEGLASTTITIANASIPYSKSVLSNTAGIATFVNIAPGTYTITATKTGYQTATVNWPAPVGVVTNAYIGLLPTGMTPVVTGTGGENLYDEHGNPIIGYDLSGNPITAGPTPDTRTAEEKDADMMNLLRDQGPMLIQFFIVCFVIYMIMGIGKGR